MINTKWKSDLYKFVGDSFDFEYKDMLSKGQLSYILGMDSTDSVDYELTGVGGFGEMAPYDGDNLVMADEKRAFKTIITPREFSLAVEIGYKQAKIDKLGECDKAGKRLGRSAAATVNLHALRKMSSAFNANVKGGDGKPWAAHDHPVGSFKSDDGRTYTPDPDSGTYDNLLNLTLSATALSKAENLMTRYVTPDGLPLTLQPDLLLVSAELEPEAKKLFGAEARLYPDTTASNMANPYHGIRYIVVSGGKDGFSAKQWAFCDSKLTKEIFKLIYITKPTLMRQQLDNPLKDVHVAYADFGIGYGDARTIVFSNPG